MAGSRFTFLFILVFSLGISLLPAQDISVEKLNQDLNAVLSKIEQSEEFPKKVALLEEALNQSKEVSQHVLWGILADTYYEFYLLNQESLKAQPLAEERASDINSWSASTVLSKAREAYTASLKKLSLQRSFDTEQLQFISGSSESLSKKPSLYEFLAHKALDFLSDPRCILQPAPADFRMQAQGLLKTPEEFVQLPLPQLDSLNHTRLALEVYQKLLDFQLETGSYQSLLYTHLRLLKWLRSYSSGLDKAGRYVRALIHLIQAYPDHSAITDVQYELALVHVSLAGDFQALGGMAYKWDYQRAREICMQSIDRFPKSEGAQKCKALIELIEKPALRIAAEEINLPGVPLRVQVHYRNLDKVFFRLYKISEEKHSDFLALNNAQIRWEFVQDFPLTKSGDTYLPNDGDHQFHRTEMQLPELEPGIYALCTSDKEEFGEALIATLALKIKQYYFQSLTQEDSVYKYLIDRQEGKALSGIPIQVHHAGNTSEMYTDSKGKIAFPRPELRAEIYKLEARLGEEFLSEEFRATPHYGTYTRTGPSTVLLTDKPDYHPGQVVQLKAFVENLNEQGMQLVKDTSLQVSISYKGRNLGELSLQVDSSGIFSGTYPLPLNIKEDRLLFLCGAAYAEIDLLPKEARKTYEIQVEQDKVSYEVKDSVRINGTFLGPPQSIWEDADLKYLITRDVRFPDWKDYQWWKPVPHHREMLVQQGSAHIDEKGKFHIAFEARPDPAHPAVQRPVYFYKIRLLATDPEGDRLLKTHNLLISHSNLALDLEVPSSIRQGDSLVLISSAKNLQGDFVPFQARLEIEALQAPETRYRTRKWIVPDLHLVPESEYRNTFPTDVYGFEDDVRSWEIKETVFQDSISSAEGLCKRSLDTRDWEAGNYRIRMILMSKEGKTLQKRKYIRISPSSATQPQTQGLLQVAFDKQHLHRGDSLGIILHSPIPGLLVQYRLRQGGKELESGTYYADSKSNKICLQVPQREWEPLLLSLSYIYNNDPKLLRYEIPISSSGPSISLKQTPPYQVELHTQTPLSQSAIAFHKRLPALERKHQSFAFGAKVLGIQETTQVEDIFLEPARASTASSDAWIREIEFPGYEDLHFAYSSPDQSSQEAAFFKDMTRSVLRFPGDRRNLEPKHRWVNLFANVRKSVQHTPSWAIARLTDAYSWKKEPLFVSQTISGQATSLENIPHPHLPGSYTDIAILRNPQGEIVRTRQDLTYQPNLLLLTEVEQELESGIYKHLKNRILNNTDQSIKGSFEGFLYGASHTQSFHLKAGRDTLLSTLYHIPDQEGVYDLDISAQGKGTHVHSSLPLFVKKKNFAAEYTQHIIRSNQKKKILPYSKDPEDHKSSIRLYSTAAFFSLRALPSLISHVDLHNPLSVQNACFALSVLEDLQTKVSDLPAWMKENYGGHLDLKKLPELSLRLQDQLRKLQGSNGAFISQDTSTTRASLCMDILQVELDLRSLGIKSGWYQTQTLEFATQYLDSLYLHVVAEHIVMNKEKARYVEIRQYFTDFHMALAWRDSWAALKHMKEEEKVSPPPTLSIAQHLEVLRSLRPDRHWQRTCFDMLAPAYAEVSSKGFSRFSVQGSKVKRKRKKIVIKTSKVQDLFLEFRD